MTALILLAGTLLGSGFITLLRLARGEHPPGRRKAPRPHHGNRTHLRRVPRQRGHPDHPALANQTGMAVLPHRTTDRRHDPPPRRHRHLRHTPLPHPHHHRGLTHARHTAPGRRTERAVTTLIETDAPTTPHAGAAPRPLVIALDVAIGTTGVAGYGWTDAIHAKQPELHQRFEHQLTGIVSFIRHADYVIVEGAAFSRAMRQGMDQLAAMRWMVRHELWKRHIPYAVVPPDNRTIYATGKARWKGETPAQVKGRVRDAVAARYGIECEGRWRYDEADAYVMLAMGLDQLGHRITDIPATHSRALAGVQWPDLTAVAR